jgi:signal transduction histidine kinase/DNA-binding response OmpR family regulator
VATVGTDSLLAAGAGKTRPAVAYDQNSLRITYGSPSLVDPEKIEYQYRLKGQTAEWSDWTGRTEQTFRSLGEGTHTFAVRARLAYGDTTNVARYAFTVLPPWYRTWWAYGLYLLAAVGIVAGAVRWRTWQLRRRRDELEATVRERTREIEEQKERLEELDEAKSRFFANISHEFRTPITLIQGPARSLRERLQRGAVDPESDAEQLGLIERNAGRLLRLVDQILGIARLEAGTYELDARPTDLGEEAARIARTFEPLAEREQLALTVETEPAPPDAEPVYVDRQALEHILSNLLSNAIKFTPEGGRVEVTVTERAEAVEVAVADTGPGIPAEEQAAIFDRFQQVDDTSTRPQEGAGIGLAFAADLVDLHGGTIDLKSTEGEGTTFTVRLRRGPDPLPAEHRADEPEAASEDAPEPAPLAGNGVPGPGDDGPPVAPTAPAAPDSAEDDAPGDGPDDSDGKVVLVVDDNGEVRQYVRSILEPAFTVVEAADGAEGVAVAREQLPDVILADVMMPSVDGHEMTRRLKQNPETEAIPVIMVTARAGTDDEVEGLQIGADDYVTKPFDADVLQQRVEGVVALQQRLRDRLREEFQEESGERAESTEDEDEERSELEREARRIIREHLTDADFDTEALAAEMAMSRATLYRRFDEQADQTPADLITAVRMDEAETLLRNGEGNVTQVAYAVGYDRLSAFSRAFRKHAGHPPSEVATAGG